MSWNEALPSMLRGITELKSSELPEIFGCASASGAGQRSEMQVLTGVNRLHGYTLGIREGSVDDGTKGYHSH